MLWKKILSQPSRLVLVVQNLENEIIGFISGGKSRAPEMNCEGEIYALYLFKEYHGKGIGKELFEEGVARLNEMGLRSCCLFVLKQNPAISFYKKFYPDEETYEKVKIGD